MDGNFFLATGWSRDGRRLAGFLRNPAGRRVAVAVYDLTALKVVGVFPHSASNVKWMPDSRRMAFFTSGTNEFLVLDTETGRAKAVDLKIPASNEYDGFAIASDGRMIYYGRRRNEADIWMVERK